MAIAALNEFYREGLAHLSSLPLPPVSPDQRFLAFLDILAEDGSRFWQDGCLLGGLASEMAATSPTVQKRVGALFAEMAAALEPMARAFVDSLSDRPMTASEMAEHFLVVVEGAIVLSRSHNDPHRINDCCSVASTSSSNPGNARRRCRCSWTVCCCACRSSAT